jgi:hypothetical protein
MDFKEAVKRVNARKPKGNFLVIKFGYDIKLVLPHVDGMAFISAITNVEQLNEGYNEQHSITPLERHKVEITQMSQEDYEHHKIAALLSITVKEAKEAALNSD